MVALIELLRDKSAYAQHSAHRHRQEAAAHERRAVEYAQRVAELERWVDDGGASRPSILFGALT